MIRTRKNHELRIESVSWRGHQVVFTYDATSEQCRHIWVECNGRVLLHLIENKSGNFNVYSGGQLLCELMTDWEHFKPEWALTYVNPRDLDGWRQ